MNFKLFFPKSLKLCNWNYYNYHISIQISIILSLQLYEKIKDATGLSKLQIKEMPVKPLNAFLKQRQCSKEIKAYIQTLRRRYRSRDYSKTKQEKDDKEILEAEKANEELSQKIEEFEKELDLYKKTVIDVALEKYMALLPHAEYYIIHEEFKEERNNLVYHANELEKLRKWRLKDKENATTSAGP